MKGALSRANRPGTSAAGAYAQDHNHAFFPTEAPITEALVRAEFSRLQNFDAIWEPACGEGDICAVLTRFGLRCEGSDLIDRGYGEGGVDFLALAQARARAAVTNPPYKDDLPEKFIRHGQKLGLDYMALLLKSNFFHTQGRAALWHDLTPAREYKIAWRPDFLGLGGGMLDVSWYVWDAAAPRRRGYAETRILVKPEAGPS